MTVTVTPEIIALSHTLKVPRASWASICPLALAIKATGVEWCQVYPSTYRIAPGGDQLPLPEDAIAFREAFDRGEDVGPGAFELDAKGIA